MADSNALRQKRKHLHASGDHSLCVPSRCGGKLATLKALPAVYDQVRFAGPGAEGKPGYGQMTEMTMETIAGLLLDDDDPRLLIGLMIVEMAKAWDDTHAPSLAREIAHQMRWLVDHQQGEADALTELRARVVKKSGDMLIAYAKGQTGDD